NVRLNCQEMERFPLLEKINRFESCWNRMQRFMTLPAVQQLFTPQANNINFAHMLNRGDILVANLSRLHLTEAQSLLCTMLFTGIPKGDRIKYQGYQTKFRPRLEERNIDTFSESATDGEGGSDGHSEGASEGSGNSFGNSISQRTGEDSSDETMGNSSSWNTA